MKCTTSNRVQIWDRQAYGRNVTTINWINMKSVYFSNIKCVLENNGIAKHQIAFTFETD